MVFKTCLKLNINRKVFSKTLQTYSAVNFSIQKCLIHNLVSLKTIPISDLGTPILNLKKNGYFGQSTTDMLRKGVIIAKVCSLSSSTLGIIMIPVINSFLYEKASENPSTMVFIVLANALLGILSLTPLLLHFLTKRFIVNIYFNSKTNVFTTVHYNFFLQKKALRFLADEIVDAAISPESKKLWIPLATCFVKTHPLLLSLDYNQYNNNLAFNLLTKNISIPKESN